MSKKLCRNGRGNDEKDQRISGKENGGMTKISEKGAE